MGIAFRIKCFINKINCALTYDIVDVRDTGIKEGRCCSCDAREICGYEYRCPVPNDITKNLKLKNK